MPLQKYVIIVFSFSHQGTVQFQIKGISNDILLKEKAFFTVQLILMGFLFSCIMHYLFDCFIIPHQI